MYRLITETEVAIYVSYISRSTKDLYLVFYQVNTKVNIKYQR